MKKIRPNDSVIYNEKQYNVESIQKKLINNISETIINLFCEEDGEKIDLSYSQLMISIKNNLENKIIRKSFRVTDGSGRKSDIIKNVAELEGIDEELTKDYIELIFEIIQETLLKGEEVSINKFGKFIPSETPAKIGVNPQSGEKMYLPKTKIVKFKQFTQLKNILSKDEQIKEENFDLNTQNKENFLKEENIYILEDSPHDLTKEKPFIIENFDNNIIIDELPITNEPKILSDYKISKMNENENNIVIKNFSPINSFVNNSPISSEELVDENKKENTGILSLESQETNFNEMLIKEGKPKESLFLIGKDKNKKIINIKKQPIEKIFKSFQEHYDFIISNNNNWDNIIQNPIPHKGDIKNEIINDNRDIKFGDNFASFKRNNQLISSMKEFETFVKQDIDPNIEKKNETKEPFVMHGDDEDSFSPFGKNYINDVKKKIAEQNKFKELIEKEPPIEYYDVEDIYSEDIYEEDIYDDNEDYKLYNLPKQSNKKMNKKLKNGNHNKSLNAFFTSNFTKYKNKFIENKEKRKTAILLKKQEEQKKIEAQNIEIQKQEEQKKKFESYGGKLNFQFEKVARVQSFDDDKQNSFKSNKKSKSTSGNNKFFSFSKKSKNVFVVNSENKAKAVKTKKIRSIKIDQPKTKVLKSIKIDDISPVKKIKQPKIKFSKNGDKKMKPINQNKFKWNSWIISLFVLYILLVISFFAEKILNAYFNDVHLSFTSIWAPFSLETISLNTAFLGISTADTVDWIANCTLILVIPFATVILMIGFLVSSIVSKQKPIKVELPEFKSSKTKKINLWFVFLWISFVFSAIGFILIKLLNAYFNDVHLSFTSIWAPFSLETISLNTKYLGSSPANKIDWVANVMIMISTPTFFGLIIISYLSKFVFFSKSNSIEIPTSTDYSFDNNYEFNNNNNAYNNNSYNQYRQYNANQNSYY